MSIAQRIAGVGVAVATLVSVCTSASTVYAQTQSTDQLRATIQAEVLADPRTKTMTQAQIYTLVNTLTIQAQKQGLTTSQLTYRPEASVSGSSTCSDISCSIAQAFGLDGSIPLIPIALLVVAALFILIYSIMREMGHPHAQV